MDKSYIKLLSLIEEKKAPQRLFENASKKLRAAEISKVKLRAGIFSAIFLAALLIMIPVVTYFLQSLSSSGFSQYLSLITTDGTSALAYWKDLGLSMASSLPINSIIIALAVILLLSYSLRRVIRYIHSIKSMSKLPSIFAGMAYNN